MHHLFLEVVWQPSPQMQPEQPAVSEKPSRFLWQQHHSQNIPFCSKLGPELSLRKFGSTTPQVTWLTIARAFSLQRQFILSINCFIKKMVGRRRNNPQQPAPAAPAAPVVPPALVAPVIPAGPAPPLPPPNNPNYQAQAPVFALSLALSTNAQIDYTSKYGQRIYETSTAALQHLYDGSLQWLRTFVQDFKDRAGRANWNSTLIITYNGAQHNLATHYGLIDTEAIRAHAMTYSGTATRNAQNAFQIYECLGATLTKEAKVKVDTLQNIYTVQGQPDGFLYFKAIVKLAQVDTRATVSRIRSHLAHLAEFMQSVDSDVHKFNMQFTQWQMDLEARGETSNDLLVNLFTGFKACLDHTFVQYIMAKEDEYNVHRTTAYGLGFDQVQDPYRDRSMEPAH